MKRSSFVKSLAGLSIVPVVTLNSCTERTNSNVIQLRDQLVSAWQRSEKLTLVNMEQMPPEHFGFKYTEEAMTFTEQWRHCVMYTCGQLASRTGITNPYQNIKLPVQMPKEQVIGEIKKMYRFVRDTIVSLPDNQLYDKVDFAGDEIPVWRLIYALENHIIHHRGQCIVYLRLSGITPKGYYGW